MIDAIPRYAPDCTYFLPARPPTRPIDDIDFRWDRIRAEASSSPHWPPPTREFLVGQETKILVPASFSPQA